MKVILGELLGTAILVGVGCSSVAMGVLYDWSLPSIALIWGLAVILGIIASTRWSGSHLNPAVSLGMLIAGKSTGRETAYSIFGQLLGSFVGILAVYLIFGGVITNYELVNGIQRGAEDSVQTAMIFGEYYPNPTSEASSSSAIVASLAEGLGTGLLMIMILVIIRLPKRFKLQDALLIGITLSLLIVVIAPYTQAGLNPARDLVPRVYSYYSGWGEVVYSQLFFIVYVLAPFIGAATASSIYLIFQNRKKRLMEIG